MIARKEVRSRPLLIGRYVLAERLGHGGMAEVWQARTRGPGGFERTLVVKRILPHLVEEPRFVEMFVREARLSARLQHPNLVQVFELEEIDGQYLLAMEYVRGHDLGSVLACRLLPDPPPPGLGAFVMGEVCRGLGYAHALTDQDGTPLRLIHRDVSPTNIMISLEGAVKLVDFGIAKALAEATRNESRTGSLKGKFAYLSPEQVEGGRLDHRADLFAAGVVLHETLTGRRLFLGASDLQTLALVRAGKIDPPSYKNPEVSPELDRICLRALSRDPAQRYQNADQMAADLGEVVRQLGWGPRELAATLDQLFPAQARTAEAPARRSRPALPALALGLLCGLGLLGQAWNAGRSAPRALPPAAPAASVLPPPPAAPPPAAPPAPAAEADVVARELTTPAPTQHRRHKKRVPTRAPSVPAQTPPGLKAVNVKGGEVVDPFRR